MAGIPKQMVVQKIIRAEKVRVLRTAEALLNRLIDAYREHEKNMQEILYLKHSSKRKHEAHKG